MVTKKKEQQRHDLTDLLFSAENVQSAMLHVMNRKNKIDSTGLELLRLPEYWEINHAFYEEVVRNECYLCEKVNMFHIPKRNGDLRTVANIPHIDMLLGRMLHQVLQPVVTEMLQESCYSFYPGRSIAELMKRIIVWQEEGKNWCVRLDIMNYFDTITIDTLIEQLREIVESKAIMALVSSFLYAPRIMNGPMPFKPTHGIIQGSPISPLLSNLFLNAFDMKWNGMPYARFCDDIFCFFTDQHEAKCWKEQADELLQQQFGLKIHPDKSLISQTEDMEILGYCIQKRYNRWKAEPKQQMQEIYRSQWTMENIMYPDKSLWLTCEGGLDFKDGAIQFEPENRKMLLFPPEGVDTIHLLHRINLSTSFFQYANYKKIRICFYDSHGVYIGDYVPELFQTQTEVVLAQARISDSESKRLLYARKILQAALHNMLYVLRQHQPDERNGKDKPGREELYETLSKTIRQVIDQMEEAEDINSLMLMEARARLAYYEAFNSMIHVPAFSFVKRSRRPPLDSLNAMISFGNVFLYNRFATEIHKARLDIGLSMLHQPEEGRNSLALDLSELFKPLIVDRAIISLVNRHEIHSEHHFDNKEDGSVFLNKEGKRIFIKELNNRLRTYISVNGKKKTWISVMQDEIYHYKKSIMNNSDYNPYRHR